MDRDGVNQLPVMVGDQIQVYWAETM